MASAPPRKKKAKGRNPQVAVPPLPNNVEEEDVEPSEEDVVFFREHGRYAGFLAKLDAKHIDRQVLGLSSRGDKPSGSEGVEAEYELKERSWGQAAARGAVVSGLDVDAADALPVKNLKGELLFRRAKAPAGGDGEALTKEQRKALVRRPVDAASGEDDMAIEDEEEEDEEGREPGSSLSQGKERAGPLGKKARKRELQRERKEREKRQRLESAAPNRDHMRESVLNGLGEYVSEQERRERAKLRMAELGTTLMAKPEESVGSLRELQQMCADSDDAVAQLAMLSVMAVFRDIVPGYRIRLPTEKEQQMQVSKEVKKLREYESMLLRAYQTYIQLLIKSAKAPARRRVAVRCLCGLLGSLSHFNFRDSLMQAVVPRMDSADDELSQMACNAMRELFANEAKQGGEATMEAVQIIADLVRQRRCLVRPEVVQVFMVLRFDENLARASGSGGSGRAGAKGKKGDGPPPKSKKQIKKEKKALSNKLRKEVLDDFREAEAVPDEAERKKMQTATLSAVFETYFRVLKEAAASSSRREAAAGDGSGAQGLGPRPLLSAALDGLAKFSHLISVEFMSDLVLLLQRLAAGAPSPHEGGEGESTPVLTTEERLQCCVVAFRVVRANLDALNVDLREFHVQLFGLLLDIPLAPTSVGRVLAEASEVMLCEGRQLDQSRVAAFAKRACTVALHVGSAEAMALLLTVRHVIRRHARCRNLLDNDAGGGGGSGGLAVAYDPFAADPESSGALSSVLWELALLTGHHHPAIATLASDLAHMGATSAEVAARMTMTPTAAVAAFSTAQGGFRPGIPTPKKSQRRGSVKNLMKAPLTDGFARLVNGGSLPMTENSSLQPSYGVPGKAVNGGKRENGLESPEGEEEGRVETILRASFKEARLYRTNEVLRKEQRRALRLLDRVRRHFAEKGERAKREGGLRLKKKKAQAGLRKKNVKPK